MNFILECELFRTKWRVSVNSISYSGKIDAMIKTSKTSVLYIVVMALLQKLYAVNYEASLPSVYKLKPNAKTANHLQIMHPLFILISWTTINPTKMSNGIGHFTN